MSKPVLSGVGSGPSHRRMARRSKDVVETVRTMIVSSELPPGTIVNESQLAERLGFGRTPVREALLLLAQEYLVKQVPGMGTTVAGLDISEYAMAAECLEVFEPFAATLAAGRITDDEVRELEAILTEARSAVERQDIDLLVRLDLRFHDAVVDSTRNRYLADAAKRLGRFGAAFTRYFYGRGASFAQAVAEHERILEALRNRDPDAAGRATKEHWHNGVERFRASL
jgi:DNA-binding GntR family transcriptional regulator